MGEVLRNDKTGFVTRSEVQIAANAADVYDLFERISEWWDSEHSFSLDANNLSIDLRPGGLFKEKLPNGGGVLHSTVIFASRGRLIRLSGALGPLQNLGAHGTLSIEFQEVEGETKLSAVYEVIGHDLNDWASPVERVLHEQLLRLKNFIEKGS